MMVLFKRLPARRTELLFSMLMITAGYGLAGLLQLQHANGLAYWLALFTLELILPLATGLMAAGMLAGDPALDILLSAHRPARQVLGERMLFVGGAGAFTGSAALLLAQKWELRLPRDGSDQVFIWLSPMVFCMGLSSAVALRRGKMLDGVLAALGVMGLSLIALLQIPRLCIENGQETACAWWLASPIMTLGNPLDPYWPLNRLFWLGLGASLLLLSLRLAQREEQLLHEATNE